MPRHNRRRVTPPPAAHGGGERRVEWNGETYLVRAVAGSDKSYRCPGCDQPIRPGTAHVVAWASSDASAEDRRHWHSGCWNARGRRAPGILRARNAPRY